MAPADSGRPHDPAPYVLGCGDGEIDRLGRQHAIWRDDAEQGWRTAGFVAGDRLLDLGCGPGFAAVDLARWVGPVGQVLGLDSSERFLDHLRRQARQLQLPQLQAMAWDLALGGPPAGGWPTPGHWDGAWCRWLAMFLPRLDPLLELLQQALRPGGRLVIHEYVRWDNFALHPHGAALQRFVDCCIRHWRHHGGDPDVAARLPALLEARGFQLVDCRSLMACVPHGAPKARWLRDFLSSYPQQLIEAGVWSPSEQQALEAELALAERHGSLWLTPGLVEMVWERHGATAGSADRQVRR